MADSRQERADQVTAEAVLAEMARHADATRITQAVTGRARARRDIAAGKKGGKR